MTRCDQWLKNFYGTMSFEDYTLLDRAARILECNSGGLATNEKTPWAPLRGIKPSSLYYFPGVWNWDSAFHAMAVQKWDPELARDQIRIFMKLQEENGKYPDVWWYKGSVFDGGSKPPVLPWAADIIEKQHSDKNFLASAYESFVKNEAFWMKCRGGEKYGLFFYDGDSENPEEKLLWGGWESGWDNSPRWDNGVSCLFAIDLNCYMVIFYRSLAHMAELLRKNTEAIHWEKQAESLVQKIESVFWNEALGCYVDYNYCNEALSNVITPASFMPLFIGTASQKRAAKMVEIARKHMMPGWPSVAYTDKAYDPTGYWRGRTWLNIAYFALKGLKQYGYNDIADAGRDTLLSWIRRDPGTIYENYNSQNGMPAGNPQFGWSAAFTIKFLLDWDLACPE